MSDIVKHNNEISTTVDEQIANSPYKNIKVGALFISEDGKTIRKITKLEVEKRPNWTESNEKQRKVDPSSRLTEENTVYDEVLKIYYVEDKNWEASEWSNNESSYWVDDFNRYKSFAQLEDKQNINAYIEEAKQVISGERKLSDYQDTSIESSGTELIHLGSKEHLETMSNGLVEHKNKAQLIKNFISRELEKQKQFLDNMRSEMGLIVQDFHDKIEKINKVIHTIELYLGIKEDITQIQSGENAHINEPICFRQKVLFMDEEVGDPRTDGQGLDFRNIEDFDGWLCSNSNYKKVIPEIKGVVILRVRRDDKKYSNNPFVNWAMNMENKKTYILIRNGDNLYRIWADINISRLFPKQTELMDLQEEAMKADIGYSEIHGKSVKQKAIKNVTDLYLQYQKHIILLQGLIDRTDIFKPLLSPIKLTDPSIHETNLVKFIYDDEISLGDGSEEWDTFLKRVNSNIGIGSRIVVAIKVNKRDYPDRYDQRYDTYGDSTYNLPSTPSKGMYLVEKYNDKPCVRYNPMDEVSNKWDWRDDGHTRKNRITFIIKPKEDWDWIIDVDNITIEEIDYYLDSRIHRRHYLRMMPVLWEIRKILVKELEEEKDFVKLMAGILCTEHSKKLSFDEAEVLVWSSVKWWKTKNKWKRALNKDESKALRMIINKLKKEPIIKK